MLQRAVQRYNSDFVHIVKGRAPLHLVLTSEDFPVVSGLTRMAAALLNVCQADTILPVIYTRIVDVQDASYLPSFARYRACLGRSHVHMGASVACKDQQGKATMQPRRPCGAHVLLDCPL